MSMIRITIRTDNAAFHADPEVTGMPDHPAMGAEVAHILRHLAFKFQHGRELTDPRDSNGYTVGAVEIIE